MKQLLPIQVNKYLFWRKMGITALKHCVNQYGRHFNTRKPIRKTPQEILKKSITNSKKWENINVGKRFSSSAQNTEMLMDFDVWLCPKLSRSIRFLYNLNFIVSSLDENFSMREFNESSMKALEVVTALLSKLKFNELEDLLTPNCKEEVEKKLQRWSKPQLEILSFNPEINSLSTPCDIIVSSDDNNNAKKCVEIRVIHYVWLPHSSVFHWEKSIDYKFALPEVKNPMKKWYICGVFNSKFIREYCQDITSQWKMNAINLKLFPHLRIIY